MIKPTDIFAAIRKRKRYFRHKLYAFLGISAQRMKITETTGLIDPASLQKWAEFHDIPSEGVPALEQYNDRYRLWYELQNLIPENTKNRENLIASIRDLIYFNNKPSVQELHAKIVKATLPYIMKQCYDVRNGIVDAMEETK